MPPGTLTALDVWVDRHDVVHQMKIHLLGSDGQTTVTFTDSRQPQSITARGPRTRSMLPPERWLGPGASPADPRPRRSVQISLKNFEEERLHEAEMSARIATMFV